MFFFTDFAVKIVHPICQWTHWVQKAFPCHDGLFKYLTSPEGFVSLSSSHQPHRGPIVSSTNFASWFTRWSLLLGKTIPKLRLTQYRRLWQRRFLYLAACCNRTDFWKVKSCLKTSPSVSLYRKTILPLRRFGVNSSLPDKQSSRKRDYTFVGVLHRTVVDKYDCAAAIQPWPKLWLTQLLSLHTPWNVENMMLQEITMWTHISYHFGYCKGTRAALTMS